MIDITVNQMTFSCGGQQAVVAFDPPLASLRDTRERVVQMDKDALQILGRSDISITTYVPPYVQLAHLINFTQCIFAYALLPRPSNFKPGSLLYDNLLVMMPALASFIAQISWIVFALMIPIHGTEAYIMSRKATRHGMTPFEAVWWKWTGSAFVEGITAFWRFDELVKEKRRQKEAKQH